MARRIDYYDDPEAPEVNSRVPAVNVFVADDEGRVLMIRRDDNGNWAVPGGGIDLGESVPQAGIRETVEETGVTCEITGILGTYTDPRHVIHYTSDGETRQEFSIVLLARPPHGPLDAHAHRALPDRRRPVHRLTDPPWTEPLVPLLLCKGAFFVGVGRVRGVIGGVLVHE